MWARPFTYWGVLMVPSLTFLSQDYCCPGTYQVGYADASKFQESSFHLPSSGIVSLWYRIWHFKHGFWVSNSGPNAYKIGKHFTKWTNPAPTSYSCWIQGGWGHKMCSPGRVGEVTKHVVSQVYFTRVKAILLSLLVVLGLPQTEGYSPYGHPK